MIDKEINEKNTDKQNNKGIEIAIQLPFVNVTIGGIEFEADISDRAVQLSMIAEKEMADKRIEKGLDKVDGKEPREVTSEEYKKMVSGILEIYGSVYDPIFGEGSVYKFYEKYPSITTVIYAFKEAMNEVNAVFKQRQEEFNTKYKKK